jgi:mRNA-degrading endonuclease YafQ of YafQ-DinJ toxin-antitoxin module
MWTIYEHRNLVRKLPGIPQEILERYEKWKDIVAISGPEGFRRIKGFHDESLRGQWARHRSSRLGLQYHVIYRVEREKVYIQVIDITTHDYRRK